MDPVTHLLYLHGFRSSPQSAKARQTHAWLQANRPEVHWWCPQLPPSPWDAVQLVAEGTSGWPRDRMAVIGSSLGGFYATVLAERTGCRAVLLNPAIEPARDLAGAIGENTAWHGEDRFFFQPRFIDELVTLRPGAVTRPERYFAVIAKGDEVLDWREMSARYAGCRVKLIDGGDHGLTDFARSHLPDVVAFLGLTS